MTCTPLQAGAHHVDITPGLGAQLAGHFESRTADSIERPLEAKALVLRSGNVTLMLISCDLLMMRAADIVDPAKGAITAQTGIPDSHVLISATHTHSGPATVRRTRGVPVDPTYLARVVSAIAEAAVGALARLEPARIGYGQSPVHGVCFNRRYRMAGGGVRTNPGRRGTDVLGPAGPVDTTVTGLIVERPDGTPMAFWANLSLHYVDAGSPTAISSDYYGAFAQRLGMVFGRSFPAQLTNGCSADINNVDLTNAYPEQGRDRAEAVAMTVVGAAIAGTMVARRHCAVELTAQLIEVELERAKVTEDDRRIAADVVAGNRSDGPFSWAPGVPMRDVLVPHFAVRLADLEAMPVRQTVPVTVMTIGELCIVGLPGEISVEHGLAIRNASRHPMTVVVGLANDHIGYVPTARAHAEGGYEAWRDGVSWTAPGSGERLVAAVLNQIGE